uniref:GAGE domain-containing protein n=1 Tax=Steinernema glaseri TaxID=37863 RepID=A0A1I7ZUH3_9BILA
MRRLGTYSRSYRQESPLLPFGRAHAVAPTTPADELPAVLLAYRSPRAPELRREARRSPGHAKDDSPRYSLRPRLAQHRVTPQAPEMRLRTGLHVPLLVPQDGLRQRSPAQLQRLPGRRLSGRGGVARLRENRSPTEAEEAREQEPLQCDRDTLEENCSPMDGVQEGTTAAGEPEVQEPEHLDVPADAKEV